MSLGPLTPPGGIHLVQPNTATGYAYEQVEFAMDYSVGTSGILPGAVAGLRPFLVSGHVGAGGYVQFGADINYWWVAGSVNSTGVFSVTGITNLGTLQYSYFNNASPGPFSTIATQSSAPLWARQAGISGDYRQCVCGRRSVGYHGHRCAGTVLNSYGRFRAGGRSRYGVSAADARGANDSV